MDAIICDISAWEYWRTPPALRDVEIPVDIARAKKPDGLGLEWLSEIPRLNIRPFDASIRERLLTDLKGVTRPVHIMLPESTRYSSDFIVAHRVPRDLPSSCVVDLGNNLGVLSPSYLLVKAPRKTARSPSRSPCSKLAAYTPSLRRTSAWPLLLTCSDGRADLKRMERSTPMSKSANTTTPTASEPLSLIAKASSSPGASASLQAK